MSWWGTKEVDDCVEQATQDTRGEARKKILDLVFPPLLDRCFNVYYVKELGRGFEAAVYEVTTPKSNEWRAFKIVERPEAVFTALAGNAGIAPKVYDIIKSECATGNHVGMVMEKMDGGLSEFLPFDEESARQFVPSCVKLIHECCELGINHLDTKLNNFLYKAIDYGTHLGLKLVLADFGESEFFDPSDSKKFEEVFGTNLNILIRNYAELRYQRIKGASGRYLDVTAEQMEILLSELRSVLQSRYDGMGLKAISRW